MSQPFPAVLGGRWSALEGGYQSNDSNGLRLPSPTAYGNLAAWYDVSDYSSLVVDASNRVSLIADKSGNSATNCLCLNGVAGNYASAPDSAVLDITGDFDLRANAALDSWTPSTEACLVGKWNAGVSQSYALTIATNGRPTVGWSTDGTTTSFIQSTVATGLSAYARKWIRATLDVDNGSGGKTAIFYTSDDGLTWSVLDTVTSAGTTNVFAGTAVVSVGARTNGSDNRLTGRIYRAQIYNGINGTLAFDANFATASKLATSFTESSSNAATVTINSSGDLGARISGERDLVQLTASKQPIYLPWSGTNYGWLRGNASDFFSTPDSAAFPTGDLDLRVLAALDDWTPASLNVLLTKSGTTRAFQLTVLTSGLVRLNWWDSGGTVRTADSTAAPTVSDFGQIWLRATLDVDNGAGGNTVTFFTSSDGATWTQLGNAVTQAFTTSVLDADGSLFVGKDNASTTMAGRIFRAQVLNGIGGTVVADFNPSLYTSGTTFTASTGEVWTLNGGATIVTATSLYFDGSDDYIQSAAFSQSQPLTNYFVGSQVSWTNLDAIYDGRADASMQLLQNVGTPTVSLSSGTPVASNSGFAIGARGLASAVFNGASSSLRINRGTATTGNPGSVAPNGLTVGARMAAGAAAGWANCTLNEQAIYSAAHDTSVQDRVIQYAGRKWGISGV